MQYFWIILGAVILGTLLGGAGYVGFEFWRYGEVYSTDVDHLRRAAYAEVERGEVTIDVVTSRIKLSAAAGGVAGFLAAGWYSLGCILRDRRRSKPPFP